MSVKIKMQQPRLIASDLTYPPLNRELLEHALKMSCDCDGAQAGVAPVRKRRKRASALDAHFNEIASILLPDPTKLSQSRDAEKLSLKDIADRLRKQTGVSVCASTIKRFLDNHPALKDLIQ